MVVVRLFPDVFNLWGKHGLFQRPWSHGWNLGWGTGIPFGRLRVNFSSLPILQQAQYFPSTSDQYNWTSLRGTNLLIVFRVFGL